VTREAESGEGAERGGGGFGLVLLLLITNKKLRRPYSVIIAFGMEGTDVHSHHASNASTRNHLCCVNYPRPNKTIRVVMNHIDQYLSIPPPEPAGHAVVSSGASSTRSHRLTQKSHLHPRRHRSLSPPLNLSVSAG